MEIGIWGDSITYGESDNEGLGWVGRFRKSFPLEDYVGVYNRGICGDTTEDLLKRFTTEAEAIQPNTILFAIGINDSKYPVDKEGNKVSLEDFKRNIESLVEQAKKYSHTIFIVGLTKVNESAIESGSKFTNEQIGIYNDCLKNFADTNGYGFINIFDVLDIQTDLYDGLHPNAQGYEKLSKVVLDTVKI